MLALAKPFVLSALKSPKFKTFVIELLEKLDDGEITRADLDIHHDIIEPVQEAIDLLEKVNLK